MTLLPKSFSRLILLTCLLLGISGCGESNGIKMTMEFYSGQDVVLKNPVPVVLGNFTTSSWPSGDFPSLEVTWDRKPEVRFNEVWIGFDSSDLKQRQNLGYQHTNTDYIRYRSANTDQIYLTINLQDIPSSKRSQIRHVTLVYRIETERQRLDSQAAFAELLQSADVLNAKAWYLATFPVDKGRDGAQAVKDATTACKFSEGKDANCLDTLAAAYAEIDDFANAVENEQKAITLLTATDELRRTQFTERLKLYQSKQKFREWPPLP